MDGIRLSATYCDERFNAIIERLKPCPFCGSNKSLDIIVIHRYATDYIAVECSNCGYELPTAVNMFENNTDRVANKWNNRPLEVSK